MASSVTSASSASQRESRDDNSSKDPAVDSKLSEGTLLVSPLPSDTKTVQLILTQSATQPVGGSGAGRAPVVIASVSPSDQTKKGSLVAKLTQSGSEHLTGGQVAKICASTPQMSNAVGAGSGKPKAFAAMLGSGDSAPPTSSPKKQSSAKRGTS